MNQFYHIFGSWQPSVIQTCLQPHPLQAHPNHSELVISSYATRKISLKTIRFQVFSIFRHTQLQISSPKLNRFQYQSPHFHQKKTIQPNSNPSSNKSPYFSCFSSLKHMAISIVMGVPPVIILMRKSDCPCFITIQLETPMWWNSMNFHQNPIFHRKPLRLLVVPPTISHDGNPYIISY